MNRLAAALFAATITSSAGHSAAGEHHHHHPAAASSERAAVQTPIRVADVPVTTQDDRRVHFHRALVKGRTVVVDFIYTSCTEICSPMTANLRQVQRLLAPALADKVSFISITIDPQVDTPAVLKAFAGQFGIEGNWTFVTADAKSLAKLQKGFAVSMARKEDHTPLILIGNDRTGQWTRKLGIARPEVIAEAIRQTAGQTDKVLPAATRLRGANLLGSNFRRTPTTLMKTLP